MDCSVIIRPPPKRKRSLRGIDSRENLRPRSLTVFPKGERLAHNFLFAVNSSRLDSQPRESLWVGSELNIHGFRFGRLRGPVQHLLRVGYPAIGTLRPRRLTIDNRSVERIFRAWPFAWLPHGPTGSSRAYASQCRSARRRSPCRS